MSGPHVEGVEAAGTGVAAGLAPPRPTRRRLAEASTQAGQAKAPAAAAGCVGAPTDGTMQVRKEEEEAKLQARIREMAAFVQARKEEEAERARQKLLKARAAIGAFAPPRAYELDEDTSW